MWNLRRFWRRLTGTFHSPRSLDHELEREVASHIALMAEEYRRRGMSAEDAALAARRRFGSVEAVKERQRDERAFRWIREARQDLRYAVRWLYKRKSFTLTTVTLLALGTGANTAMFSVVDGVLLRAVPYERPHELFRLYQQPQGGARMPVSPANFLDWQAQSRSFASMAAFTGDIFRLTVGNETPRVQGTRASRAIFETLSVSPALGRAFQPGDDRPGAAPVVVLSHSLWVSTFGGAQDIVGRPIPLNGQPHTVLGVMPAGFAYPGDQTSLWVPLRAGETPRTSSRTENYVGVIGRTRRNITQSEAEAELAVIAERLATAHPDSNRGMGIALTSVRQDAVGSVETAVIVLMSAVVFVLLIAAVSVSNLLLATVATRRREIALRLALGASRGRVVRQMLAEAMLLAVLGSAAGWLLANATLSLLLQIVPPSVPGIARMRLDGTVLAFSMAVACALGVIFGLAPALSATRDHTLEGLNQGSRGSLGPAISYMRRSMLVVQIAFALMLLVGASLMLRTMLKLSAVDLGFEPAHVLTVPVRTSTPAANPSSGGESPSVVAIRDLLDRVAALPGVRAVAATSAVPTTIEYTGTRLVIEGHAIPPGGRVPEIDYSVVTPGYFRAMEIPLIAGRLLSDDDGRNAPPAAVINESMAARYFQGADPVGRRVRRGGLNSTQPWITVVGVVGDVRHLGVDRQPVPELFLPHAQVPWPGLTMMVRASGDPAQLVAPVRGLVRELGTRYELDTPRTLTQLVGDSVGTRRFAARLLSLFGALATIVAAIGIYTVVTFAIVHRTREFGVRMALGATKRDLARMVLAQSAAPILAGIALGLVASSGLAGLAGSLLYEVDARDTASFGAAALLLGCVGLAASYPPVRRVFRIDPAVTLRSE